jgi:hypothetical protein
LKPETPAASQRCLTSCHPWERGAPWRRPSSPWASCLPSPS